MTVIHLQGSLDVLIEAHRWACEFLPQGSWQSPWSYNADIHRRITVWENDWRHDPVWRDESKGIQTWTFDFFNDTAHVYFRLRWCEHEAPRGY